MAVTVNATCTAVVTASLVATMSSTTMTVATGATALLAMVIWGGTNTTVPSAITVQWDALGTPQTMTQLAFAQRNTTHMQIAAMYGLLAPTVGNKTLRVTWTNSAINAAVFSVAFAGTATDTIANAFMNANTNTGSSTSATVTGVSAVNNIAVCNVVSDVASTTAPAATGSTSLYTNFTNVGNAGARAPGAASVAWSSTIGSTNEWAIACIDVSVPAAVTAPFPPWPAFDMIQLRM